MAGLVVFSATLPKLRDPVDSPVDTVPVPLSATVNGLLLVFAVSVSVPVCAPDAVGAKATSTVQLPPPASVVELLHVPPVTVNPAEAVIEEMLKDTFDCSLPKPMALDGLVVLTASLPKFSDVAETAAAATPVPLSVTVVVELGAVVVMVSELAGTAPSATGLNVRLTVQLAPAFKVGFRHVEDGAMA